MTRHPELFDLYVGIGQLAYFGAKNREVQSRFVREEAARRGDEDALQAVAHGDRSLESFLFRYGTEVRGETSFWPLFFRGLADNFGDSFIAMSPYRFQPVLASQV